MATICMSRITVERVLPTNMVPLKKRPFEESKSSKTRGPIPKKPKLPEESLRLEQLELIFNTCYSMYFVDRLENPLIIPHIIVNSCDLLERVRLKIPIRRTYKHIAAACLLLTCQIESDMIGAFSRKEFIKRFHDTDPTLTTTSLSKAQKQVLEAINYELWYNNESRARIGRWPLLELDPDLESRYLESFTNITCQKSPRIGILS